MPPKNDPRKKKMSLEVQADVYKKGGSPKAMFVLTREFASIIQNWGLVFY